MLHYIWESRREPVEFEGDNNFVKDSAIGVISCYVLLPIHD